MSLPNLLVIGAQKSGTTALFLALYKHPQIYMPRAKEPWFFAYRDQSLAFTNPNGTHYNNAIYTDLARYQALYAGAGDVPIRGEASTAYLMADCAEIAAANIQEHLPDVKLVAILRQPAERAYSAFCHLRMLQSEPERDFQRALAVEAAAARARWSPDFRYRANGYYAALLTPYLARFDRAQIHIILYDEWLAQPEATLSALFEWLGVGATLQPSMFQRVYESRAIRSRLIDRLLFAPSAIKQKVSTLLPTTWRQAISRTLQRLNRPKFPPLSPQIWQELTNGYQEDILQLQGILNRDLHHWLVPRR